MVVYIYGTVKWPMFSNEIKPLSFIKELIYEVIPMAFEC